MDRHAYPAAHAVAPKVHAHFARHQSEARALTSETVAPLPDTAAIAKILEAAFWASLRREEGYVPKISVAYLPPDASPIAMRFERPLALDPHVLTKIAPAVERAGIHLGAWPLDGELVVWGTARALPPLCFVLEVAAPGLLVVKHQRAEGKFVNVAVLEGDEVKMVDETASSLPDCPSLLASLLGFAPTSWADPVNVLVQLAVSMRAHGRGGTLLVVPAGSADWRASIVQPIAYAVSPAFSELADRAGEQPDPPGRRRWQLALNRAVDAVAGLTAVDGATLLTADYELLAFGAKIARRKGSPQVEQVSLTEPVEGGVAAIVNPGQLGGTRHLSAAQFVHDQRDALAMVASQDGRFTTIAWSPCEAMVHAHRVEALLL